MSEFNMIPITSPLNDEVIGHVKAMTKQEVDLSIKKAKNAFKLWRNTSVFERTNCLNKAADILMERKCELADLIVKEIGKNKKAALSEVVRTVDFIRFTADIVKNIQGQNISAESFPGGKKGKFAITKREPLGVVLAISPFNYPVNLAASKIAPAIVGGNTVVFKPATQGSLSGIFLSNIFKDAGFPDGVLCTITGKGSEIGDYTVTHDDIDFINFTGSTKVGQHIALIADMVPMLMELGGKDAAIVLEDAELDIAVTQIISGAFSYSGQRCTAIKRVIVVEDIADKLVEKINNLISKVKIGNPLESDDDFEVVPLINKSSADYVEELINDAINKGAKLIYGGNRTNNLIEPTLFDHVTENMRLAWEEPFGPVLPILRVKDMDDAIELANKSEYGLQSSVFTNDLNKAFEVAEKLEVGTVQINNKTERGPDNLPFLGVKNSGIGVQGILYSIEAMTRIKSTVINLFDIDN